MGYKIDSICEHCRVLNDKDPLTLKCTAFDEDVLTYIDNYQPYMVFDKSDIEHVEYVCQGWWKNKRKKSEFKCKDFCIGFKKIKEN